MILAVVALRAVVEVALFALLGQGLLALLTGKSRERNPIYLLFRLLARPPLVLLRRIVPQAIGDRHFPVVAFFILLWLWLFLAYLKRVLGGMA